MTAIELIGKVGAAYLRARLAVGELEGTARFIIDCLSAAETASIAREVLNDATLRQQFEIRLPSHFVNGLDLPEEVLTSERATYFRNSECTKAALLLANTGDDEEQSLKELVPIGAAQLQEQPELWVQIASEGLPITSEHLRWWEKALTGVLELRLLSLERLAEYVIQTRLECEESGLPIVIALGVALPALRMPRDSCYFRGLNEKTRGHTSKWKALFASAAKKRACYLIKQTPSQVILSEEDLTQALERVGQSIPEIHHPVIREFIAQPSGWNPAAQALASCEWEEVKPLFDGLRREKFNIGQATIEFYDDRDPELLNDTERDYLKGLIARRTTECLEEDEGFYEAHRNELKDDRKLKSVWDRFVFGKARETHDFISGLALCCEPLFSQEQPSNGRKLIIRCDRANKKDLKDLNVDAGLYFATRYRGIQRVLGSRVHWEVGKLFDFPDLLRDWRGSKKVTLNRSASRAALQLKFLLELEVELVSGGVETYTTQLIWNFDQSRVTSELVEDWGRLCEHPLVYCSAMRESMSSKGRFQTVDLFNVRTFVPAYDKDRGSFVSVYRTAHDVAIRWRTNLSEAVRLGSVSTEIADRLSSLFDAFEAEYGQAICALLDSGIGHPSLLAQADCFASLLDEICVLAKGDRNRELLLRPLLRVGVVAVEGGQFAVIVAPWHPLRLASMARKARLVGGLMKYLLTAKQVFFGDTRLYFRDLGQALDHPFYPEVVLGWQENKPHLLSVSDVCGDYSLHEPPIASDDGLDDTNENPGESANRVLDLVRRYLALHPHEKANLSVVLFNCDSARLPQAVVDRIGDLNEDEDDVRCNIILRHRDSQRLRHLYEGIVENSDNDADSFNASETTRDFMARLRIAIMADQAPTPDPKDGCPADIVFSQDVIARHAHLEWYSEPAKPADPEYLLPARWSRRRPAAKDDMKSVVYLCCPVQSREGWSLLTALTTFLKGDWDGDTFRRLLPARQLDFQETATARIFEETHNLANWVVNYDELLDRRQLLNQNVRVIRFKQSTTQGRNIIVSSKAPLGLLRSMVSRRIKDLNLPLDDTEVQRLTERFIADAGDVSGDIVLRAAKRGRNASELMGIVLSRFLIRHELGPKRHFGWYFLDDYADWLGQREEQIADMLVLSPHKDGNGQLTLTAIVSEAKYIDAGNLAVKRKESQKQLRETVIRIDEAVFGDPQRLDRDLWLARLSDLILDGVQFPASANIQLTEWRRAIREGGCAIRVRGYSHIFVSGPADASDCSSVGPVAELSDSYQEVFSRSQVRDIVMDYFHDRDPMPIRRASSDTDIWSTETAARAAQPPMLMSGETENSIEGDHSTDPDLPNTGQNAPTVVHVTPGDTVESRHSWAFNGIQALLSPESSRPDGTEGLTWLAKCETQTKAALQQFQLQAKLLSSKLTPNAALLKFAGSANLTVEQILKRRTEFLTTHGLNIISVQPEPGVIALAVERPERQILQVRDLWRRWLPNSTAGNQRLLIAVREDDGECLFLAPGTDHAPHTLIAGSTGSGKSVLMQNIILGIAATNHVCDARIIIIDPKQGVDYFQFEGLPHLDGGLIDKQEDALSRLQALVSEMDERYVKLRKMRTPNVQAYNRVVPAGERLPTIWLIHDEFAEWMLIDEYKQHVTSMVARLGVKARAAGIYLVFAAQRPDANVMPMQLRANLGNRLILRVDSEGTSEIALGEKGAERLLGRGHLLAKLEGSPVSYAQVPFVDAQFMEEIATAIGNK